MKHLIRILLVCLISSSNTLACGWYPFGDEVRFSLVDPAVFDDGGMSPYYYTAELYGYSFESTKENDPNIALWKAYCKNEVSAASIYQAVYEISEKSVLSGKSKNSMINYLTEIGDTEALKYLAFAKSCSDLNYEDDGWERDHGLTFSRSEKMLEALKRSKRVSSEIIKKRYRYLAVRLAYYNGDEERLNAIYSKSFIGDPKDAIDYWALYFHATTDEISARRNFKLAQVFVNAPGKRFGVLTHFSQDVPIKEALSFAKNDIERANVYVMYGIRERGRSLETLKKVQQLDPKNVLMDYLLVRELNKVEDWILTPRYTHFRPTVDVRGRLDEDKERALIEARIKDDEKYGLEMANWIGSLNTTAFTHKLVEAHLTGITENTTRATALLSKMKDGSEEKMEIVERLALLYSVRSNAKRTLTPSDQTLLMNSEQHDYNLFLFAISREYEFQQQFDFAAALFSHVNSDNTNYRDEVSWKSKTGKETLNSDYFYSWFFYIDAEYTPEQVQSLINLADQEFDKSTEFDRWLRTYLLDYSDKLYDLLGTKYVRKNDMNTAILAFQKVKGTLWNSYPYTDYLNANPFHADFYSGHKPSEFDTVTYTKLEIAKQYQSYLKKAEDPSTKNRAYYYFLVANCELNMSHLGNSWMMRRYYWTSAMNPNNLEDDDDFFRMKRAIEFYQKAHDQTTDEEVKALCLRMMGRCENQQLAFDAPSRWEFDYDRYGGYNRYLNTKNGSYAKLKERYPDDSDELLSNCFSFQRYFEKLKS